MSQKMCESCGAHPATVHYRETVNGVTNQRYLCAECARKAGIGTSGIFSEDWMKPFTLFAPKTVGQKESEVCPVCQTSLSRIRREGKFGCSACYDAFASRLDMTPFVGGGYRGGRLGKPEAPKAKPEEKQDSVSDLKKQLQEAVKAENYELAAILRDRIRGEEAK